MKYKTIFMGTPEFSIPSLQTVFDMTDLTAIFTQPDKKRGRGQKLSASPVKTFGLEKNIDVHQPNKMKESIDVIKNLEPDLIIVVAYGKILPQSILEIPRFGCINVHASLLPRYRGAAPMQWTLINGETYTGVTTMKMDVGLDTGDILLQREIGIEPEMNFEQLHDVLKIEGAICLKDTLENFESIKPRKQDDRESNYSPMITKEIQRINWKKSAWEIHNLVRAMDSHPGSITTFKHADGRIETLKIWKTRVVDNEIPNECPGDILKLENLSIAASSGVVQILELQAQNGKRMSAENFLRGHDLSGGKFE